MKNFKFSISKPNLARYKKDIIPSLMKFIQIYALALIFKNLLSIIHHINRKKEKVPVSSQ